MTPMAILVITLFATLLVMPLVAAWFANRAGLFAANVGKVARVINFPDLRDAERYRHRHIDAA